MKEWILHDLSTPVALLNNFSKCPYAKTAFLENKVKFYDDENNVNSVIENLIKEWDNTKIEVAIIKLSKNVTGDEITDLVNNLNNQYTKDDFLFLDDHIDNKEIMNDITFNNGKYNVLFLQRKSKIDDASKKLEKLGYYKNWTKEYYNDVVGWRSQWS